MYLLSIPQECSMLLVWDWTDRFSIIFCKPAMLPHRQRKCTNADSREALNLRQWSGQKLDSLPITKLQQFPSVSQTDCQLFLWKIASSVSLNISRLRSFLVVSTHRCAHILDYNLGDQKAVSEWTFLVKQMKVNLIFWFYSTVCLQPYMISKLKICIFPVRNLIFNPGHIH